MVTHYTEDMPNVGRLFAGWDTATSIATAVVIAGLALCALLYWWLVVVPRRRHEKQQLADQAERRRREAQQQARSALAQLTARAAPIVDPHHAALTKRVSTLLGRLGTTDQPRARASIMVHLGPIDEAARTYEAIMRPDAPKPDDDTLGIAAYRALTVDINAAIHRFDGLGPARELVLQYLDNIEEVIRRLPGRVEELTATIGEISALLDQRAEEGFDVTKLRNRLASCKGMLTRMRGYLKAKNYLSACDYLPIGAVKDIHHAAVGLTERHAALSNKPLVFRQDYDTVDALVKETETTLSRLRRAFDRPLIREAAELYTTARNHMRQLHEWLDTLDRLVAAKQLEDAEALAQQIESAVAHIRHTHEQVAETAERLAEEAQEAAEARGRIVVEVTTAEEILRERGVAGRYRTRLQQYHDQLEVLTTQAARRNPAAALKAFRAIKAGLDQTLERTRPQA